MGVDSFYFQGLWILSTARRISGRAYDQRVSDERGLRQALPASRSGCKSCWGVASLLFFVSVLKQMTWCNRWLLLFGCTFICTFVFLIMTFVIDHSNLHTAVSLTTVWLRVVLENDMKRGLLGLPWASWGLLRLAGPTSLIIEILFVISFKLLSETQTK